MNCGIYWLVDYLCKYWVYVGKDGQEILVDIEVKFMNKMYQIFSGIVFIEKKDGIVFDNSKVKFIKEYFVGKKIGVFYKFIVEWVMLVSVFGFDWLIEDFDEFNWCDDKVFYSQI